MHGTEPVSYTHLYMALGTLTGTYQTCVFPEHPLYRFVDGAFKPLSQVGYDASVAVGETRQEMSTRFEQTDAAIALKADQTEVDSLSTRVQSAEQKIDVYKRQQCGWRQPERHDSALRWRQRHGRIKSRHQLRTQRRDLRDALRGTGSGQRGQERAQNQIPLAGV